jgi:hypothetical protein
MSTAMHPALSLLLVVLTCFCCTACSGSHKAFSVREVERVFAEHGLPFASEVVPNAKPNQNPYLRPKSKQQRFFGLPLAKEHELDRHLRALLTATNPTIPSGRVVYVFDSASSLRLGQRLFPGLLADRKGRRIVRGNSTEESGCIMHRENVVAEASYDECARIRAILADLH